MNRENTVIIIVFFVGVLSHIALRIALEWKPKHQNFYWLGLGIPMGISLFILPGLVSDLFVNATNSLIAGMAVSEYLRLRYSHKFEKLSEMKGDIEKWREAEQAPHAKKPKRKQRPE